MRAVTLLISALLCANSQAYSAESCKIDGIGNRGYNALAVRHDEVVEKKQNEINLFKIKYIKICLSNITNKKATN